MSINKYKLADDTWDSEELCAIKAVIKSNHYTMGRKTKEFEDTFSDYFGSNYGIMVNSGSSANLLAIAALVYSGRLATGDEVIVPAVSWSTTYCPIHQLGLKLVFVDINLKTLNIDVSQIESAISEKTKAVFVVNLLGNPNDFKYLTKVCSRHNLLLLEDNCESMGAMYDGSYCGTIGLFGTFSTYFSHHISTMEGGMVLTNDEELYHYMLSIRSHGWTRNLPSKSKLYSKSSDSFYESFNFILPGFNLRPLEFEAAIGLKQINKLSTFVSNRRENAKLFTELFKKDNRFILQQVKGDSSWFGFSVVLAKSLKGKRSSLVKYLSKNGIEVRPIVAGNFVRNKVIDYMNHRIYGTLSNADYIHENGFFIGNHSTIIHDEILLFKKLIDSFLEIEL